jgi:hypothetical protein
MNRPAPKNVRPRFLVALGQAIHVAWPVLSAILVIELVLGLLEGWTIGDAVYFAFITGLTIGYGDIVPRQTFTRALAVAIGFCGLLLTGLVAAIGANPSRTATRGDARPMGCR